MSHNPNDVYFNPKVGAHAGCIFAGGRRERVLSGCATPEDLNFCRSLEPLRELVRTALITGETESDGFDRLMTRNQNLPALTSLARAGGDYFDYRGYCRSEKHARAFIDAALAAADRGRLAPKALMCGRAQVVSDEWNDFTVRHSPNYGAWSLQLVCQGKLKVSWGNKDHLCHAGDILVIPPQASSVHRAAPGIAHYDEFWFHFFASSRWLQYLDWVPRLSSPSISRATGPDHELAKLCASIVALNGMADKLQQQLQEAMFEQLLIRQRMRLGSSAVERPCDQAEVAKSYLMDHLFEPITLQDLTQHCGLSASRLFDVFKASTGCSPMQWRERERMTRAGELLHNSKVKVWEVAAMTGFEDYRHFAKRFKVVTGLTPSGYRKQHVSA